MSLKKCVLSVLTFLSLTLAPAAADTSFKILFSNPLVRENSALPKLPSLRFVTVDSFAPFSAFDEKGALRGVHVDLARAICSEMKIDTACTIQAVAFEDIETLLTSDRADIALSGILPSQQNRSRLAFSVPYFRYPSKFLTRNNAALKSGAAIGAIKNSVHERMAELLFPDYKLASFMSDGEAFSALQAGTISAFFGDGMKLAALSRNDQPINCCTFLPENYFLPELRPDTLTAAVASSRADVLAAVNAALRQMAVDGRLDEIYLRYLPVNPLR